MIESQENVGKTMEKLWEKLGRETIGRETMGRNYREKLYEDMVTLIHSWLREYGEFGTPMPEMRGQGHGLVSP